MNNRLERNKARQSRAYKGIGLGAVGAFAIMFLGQYRPAWLNDLVLGWSLVFFLATILVSGAVLGGLVLQERLLKSSRESE